MQSRNVFGSLAISMPFLFSGKVALVVLNILAGSPQQWLMQAYGVV